MIENSPIYRISTREFQTVKFPFYFFSLRDGILKYKIIRAISHKMYEIIGIVLFTFIKKKNFARIRFNREARFDLYRIFTREFQIAKFYESKAGHSYGINIKRFYILIHHPFQFLIKCTKLQESYFVKKKNP